MMDPYNGIKFPSDREVEARKSAQEILRMLNDFGHDESIPAFCDEIRRGHRTLQQTFFKLICEMLRQWSDDSRSDRFDGRNEFTVKTADKLVDALKEVGVIYESPGGTRVTVPFI